MPRFYKITSLIFIIIIIGLSAVLKISFSGHIMGGIKVNGMDVGGLTLPEAEEKLLPLAERLRMRTLYFTFENKRWSIDPDLLGLKADLAGTLKDAYGIGRNGKLTGRLQETYLSLTRGRKLTMRINLDDQKLVRVLNTLSREIHVSPQGTQLEIAGNKVKIIQKGIEGKELLLKETKDRVKSVLAKGDNNIELAVIKVKPGLTEEMLAQFKPIDVIASFNTGFNPLEDERNRNIEIAANSLTGYVIRPGETFSFNQVVGPRSEEEGYKKAMVIINNRFVPDWGGGVCQVSTTLYNTALLADMEIVERREHSRPVKYVPPGRGSTVAYGLIDLRLRNQLKKPVIIWTKTERDNLTVYFLGAKDSGKEVIIESTGYMEIIPRIVTKESNNIPWGQEVVEEKGSGGYRVTTWRIVKQDGKTVRREMIAKDKVEALDRVVVTGTGETIP